MTRLYDATWDEMYFHSDNRYDADDIQRVRALAAGERVALSGSHHIVKRTQ
jgi:hypothetical protein